MNLDPSKKKITKKLNKSKQRPDQSQIIKNVSGLAQHQKETGTHLVEFSPQLKNFINLLVEEAVIKDSRII